MRKYVQSCTKVYVEEDTKFSFKDLKMEERTRIIQAKPEKFEGKK